MKAFAREHMRHVFKIKNMSISDIVMVDGRTANEIWGQKYANVENLHERNLLIQAEILKEVYKGEKSISAKSVKLKDDYTVEFGEPKIVVPSREKAVKFMESKNIMLENLSDTAKLLEDYKKQLKTTMDRKGDFGTDSMEGSKYFKNMGKALQKFLNDYENGGCLNNLYNTQIQS